MYAAIGLVGGLVVAIAYVLIRDLADSTLRDKSFVEKKYNVKAQKRFYFYPIMT